MRLSPSVQFEQFGPLKQSFGLCHEGSYPLLRRWVSIAIAIRALRNPYGIGGFGEHLMFRRRLPHRLSAAYFSTAGSPWRDTNTERRVKVHGVTEISSTWVPTAWPRSVRQERLRRVRDRAVLKSCPLWALIRLLRAMTRPTIYDERCDDSVYRISRDYRCCSRGRIQSLQQLRCVNVEWIGARRHTWMWYGGMQVATAKLPCVTVSTGSVSS